MLLGDLEKSSSQTFRTFFDESFKAVEGALPDASWFFISYLRGMRTMQRSPNFSEWFPFLRKVRKWTLRWCSFSVISCCSNYHRLRFKLSWKTRNLQSVFIATHSREFILYLRLEMETRVVSNVWVSVWSIVIESYFEEKNLNSKGSIFAKNDGTFCTVQKKNAKWSESESFSVTKSWDLSRKEVKFQNFKLKFEAGAEEECKSLKKLSYAELSSSF